MCPGACSYFAQDLQDKDGAGLVGHSLGRASGAFQAWEVVSNSGCLFVESCSHTLRRMSSGLGVVSPA